MSELQNNPEPLTYVIERAGEGLRDWRVSRIGDDGGDNTELGVYETYTEAVAAVNEDRGVDTEDLKAEATDAAPAEGDDGHGYGAYQANPNDPNYDNLQAEDGDGDDTKYDDDWDDHSEPGQH